MPVLPVLVWTRMMGHDKWWVQAVKMLRRRAFLASEAPRCNPIAL